MKRLLSAFLSASFIAGLLSSAACASSALHTTYTTDTATLVSFSDNGVTAKGKYTGCGIDGTAVTISEAGTYVFSGSCTDGSITVKKGVTNVTLVLDGLSLASATTAPITLNKGSTVQMIAAAGSRNTLSDTAGSNDENAGIKAKANASLTLGGTGTLLVNGNVKNGVKGAAESSITVEDLTLQINAVDDGLSCDHLLTVKSGALDIQAGGDALKASPDTDDETAPDTVSKGDITLAGGTLTLHATGDGIQADGNLTVTGGSFQITTNGGHQTTLTENADSCKGLKAGKALTISGGKFTLDTADDALHTNGDLSVTDGTLTLASGDDALHADNALTVGKEGDTSVTSPKINITACYEGLEGTTIDIYSGDIDVKASDDALNAANSTVGLRSDAFALNIHGGDLYAEAGADALDSNHDITIDGGTVEVYGANTGGDCAIDYDNSFILNGGTLLGAGMSPTGGSQPYILVGQVNQMGGGGGMRHNWQDGAFPAPDGQGQNGQMPSPPNGEQNQNPNGQRPMRPNRQPGQDGQFMRPGKGEQPEDFPANGERPDFGGGMPSMESTIGIKAGSEIMVKDASGETLYTATATGPMGNVIYSSPTLKEGETCTVWVDGTEVGSAEAVLGTGRTSNTQQFAGKPQQEQKQEQSSQQQDSNQLSFQDVTDSDWFAASVQYAVAAGIMNGMDLSTFAPNEPMTRAMLATVLYRLSGETTEAVAGQFQDVAVTAYYAPAVTWASEKGIVNGTGQNLFSPDTYITREQLAVMLYRYAGGNRTTGDLSGYHDVDSISSYARDAVEWCAANGILTGKAPSSLDPQGTATRAEVATILQRFTRNA